MGATGDVEVRRARLEDWEGYLATFEAVAGEGRWIGRELPLDRDGLRAGFERGCDDAVADTVTFVADAGGAGGGVVGLCGVGLSFGHAELGMAIADGWRGAGLGRRLLDAAVGWAREVGAHKVSLEVWPHNERAIRLYERAGFVVEGRHRRHWRRRDGSLWDSLSMGLVLDEDSPGSPH